MLCATQSWKFSANQFCVTWVFSGHSLSEEYTDTPSLPRLTNLSSHLMKTCAFYLKNCRKKSGVIIWLCFFKYIGTIRDVFNFVKITVGFTVAPGLIHLSFFLFTWSLSINSLSPSKALDAMNISAFLFLMSDWR